MDPEISLLGRPITYRLFTELPGGHGIDGDPGEVALTCEDVGGDGGPEVGTCSEVIRQGCRWVHGWSFEGESAEVAISYTFETEGIRVEGFRAGPSDEQPVRWEDLISYDSCSGGVDAIRQSL